MEGQIGIIKVLETRYGDVPKRRGGVGSFGRVYRDGDVSGGSILIKRVGTRGLTKQILRYFCVL